MHIKKLILLLFLVPVLAQAQKTTGPNYTYIAQRYEWLAGVFKALGIPAGDSAQFQTGQEMRAGALYYDSVGVDSGLYVWSGLAWNVAGTSYTDADARAAISMTNIGIDGLATYTPATGVINTPDYTTTASEGITKVGSDFQLGGLVTEDKTISVDNNNHQFQIRKTVGDYPFAFVSEDTISGGDPFGNKRSVGFVNGRTLKFPSYSTTQYKGGSVLSLNYQIKDSAQMATIGGDFGFSNKTTMQLSKMSGYSGRSVYMSGDGALSLSQGVPVQISDLTLQHSTSTTSNYRYAKGYWIGSRSYLVIGQADTLQKWVGFHNMGFMQGTAQLDYSFDFVGGSFGDQSVARVTNPWFLYGHSTRSKSLIAGPTGFGDSLIEASALIDASSTTKGVIWPRMTATQRNAISSPATGLMVFDTDSTSYFQYNGSAWQNLYNTGGGGGSGTVNSGTQYRLGYYATTGDAVSEAAAITGDRALISDVNGVPTHSATTATEIGHVSGVTSAIQTQLDAKISGSLTATRVPFATAATTLADDAAMTWDNTSKKLLIGDGTNTTGILTVNGGNQSGTGSQIIIQNGGTNRLHIGGGPTGYMRAANNVNLSLETNGSGNLLLTGAGTGGIDYSATNAAGLHTFKTNAVTRAIINNNGLNLAEQAEPSTPAAGLTSIYSTDGNVYSKDDAGTVRKMTTTLTRHGNVIDPLSTDDRFVFSTDVAITITSVKAVLVGSSTPSVTYNIVFDADRSAAGTNVYTAGQTVTSTTTMTAASGVNDATIPAGSIVRVKLSAVSGTVGELDVSITYTED